MRIEFPSREFDAAVAAVCHGEVSNDQARALNELLRGNSAARDEYIFRLELHSQLASQLDLLAAGARDRIGPAAASSLEFPGDARCATVAVAPKRRIIWPLALAASLVLLAAVAWRWQVRVPRARSDEKPAIAAAENDWKPSSANLPGQEYPRINAEGRAQFRIKAPDAKHVSVNMGHPLTVAKSDDGVWTITTSPLGIGFHFYQVVLDGKSGPDPATPIFRGGGGDGFSSGVEVPTGENFHERKNVPHGDVREQRYFSKTTGEWRRIFVYTPPDYRQNASARFPVLYLLPGAGEDESAWPAQGRVSQILDNLIAEKTAKPMMVVMEAGSAHLPGELDNRPRPPADWNRRFIALEEVFVNDLIPFIDGTYHTLSDGKHRAIAGLSLGGGQAFAIGLRHPDRFEHVGGFSGVGGGPGRSFDPQTAYDGVMVDADTFNRNMRLVFVSAGGDEPDWVLNGVKRFHEALLAMGVNHVFYASPDTGHEWHTWRRSLREFASLLFKE
jgi:enterochelin esterase family protein